jgi:hypothetical protein
VGKDNNSHKPKEIYALFGVPESYTEKHEDQFQDYIKAYIQINKNNIKAG